MPEEQQLSPEYAPVLQMIAQAPPLSSLPIDEARARWDMMDFGETEEVTDVRELTIPGPTKPIPARFYRHSDDPIALIVYLHGGGWVLGGLTSHDKSIRGLVCRTNCAILAIDYRLAPEHPFPAGLDDSYAALLWAAENASSLVGPDKPLFVAGDSAGGNLAAAIALRAKRNGTPKLDGQVLIYPATDGSMSTGSYNSRATGSLLSADDMDWFWSNYIADPSVRSDPQASVCRAEDLTGLPPTILLTAEFDPLLDEGREYGRKMEAAGVRVKYLHFDDQPHGFMTFYQFAPSAAHAFDELAAAIVEMATR